jgi:hypothetical protein
MLDNVETPGLFKLPKEESPYERILESDETPGSVLTEDNP